MRVFTYLLSVLLLTLACKSRQPISNTLTQSNKRPHWVDQRPVNPNAYVGIGRASKTSNPADYLQVAKKEALQDLVGEIKVNVSTNSLLSQYQNNTQFNQQFFSDTRLVAQAYLQNFTVVDSWENKNEYWIYYTLNKADYEAEKQKQMRLAAQQAVALMEKADDLLAASDFVNIFKLRVKALGLLQNFLNEAVSATYQGKEVYLVNELMSGLQKQLFQLKLSATPTQLKVVAGKAFDTPIACTVSLIGSNQSLEAVPYLPLLAQMDNERLEGNQRTETDDTGVGLFGLSRTYSKNPIQFITLKPDLNKLIRGDSLNLSLRTILLRLESPTAQVRLSVEPVKIFILSKELNQGKPLAYRVIEPAVKKRLAASGCLFVANLDQADYYLEIIATTKNLGAIWGTMQQSVLDMEVMLKNPKSGEELLHENISGIQGFQNNPEKAGLEAYKVSLEYLPNRIYPALEKALFLNGL